MSEQLLHATSQHDWDEAQRKGKYTPHSLSLQGFTHCSTAAQILRVVNTYYPGRKDMLLLVIEPSLIKSEIRWEPGDDVKTELFPHVYGPIPLAAVVGVLPLPLGPDGKFILPPSLTS